MSNQNKKQNKQENNPRNASSVLYKRLTRLLSGPLNIYRAQDYRKQKPHQMDKYGSLFKSASGQAFKKSSYDPFSNVKINYISNQNRSERYADFDQMEYTPEIASAMDIYADEMTTHTLTGKMLKIESRNEEIRTILNNLYDNVLNVEFNLFGWCRSMCKYGDFFLYLDIDDALGVTNVIGLPSMEVERLEGEDETNPNYIQFQWNQGGMTFENWQVAHFRILGNDKYAPYGTSILEPARRIWRQLTLLEDAMMAYRIVRSPERRLFKIEVGGIAPEDVPQYMERVQTQLKRNSIIDSSTGRVDLRYNPLSVEEDYFLPMRNGVGSDIGTLAGGTYTGDIDDVKYLRDKLFSALKVPQSYLSRGEGSEEDKTTLAQKDVRFARTIQRLQRSVISELEKVGVVHLYTLGYRGDDLINFKIALNNPSKISELQELEHWRTKFDVAAAATEGFFSKRWVATNMFGMSEGEYLRNIREMFYDRQVAAQLELETQAASAVGGGGLGGDMGGDLGGGGLGGDMGGDLGAEGPGEGLGGEPGGDLGGDLGGEAPTPEPGGGEAGGETDLLAAPPAKRDIPPPVFDHSISGLSKKRRMLDEDDEDYDRSKGKKYTPVRHDKRTSSAPRKKSFDKLYNKSATKSTRRNLYPGLSGLTQQSLGIFENAMASEEEKILSTSKELVKLTEQLEKTKK